MRRATPDVRTAALMATHSGHRVVVCDGGSTEGPRSGIDVLVDR